MSGTWQMWWPASGIVGMQSKFGTCSRQRRRVVPPILYVLAVLLETYIYALGHNTDIVAQYDTSIRRLSPVVDHEPEELVRRNDILTRLATILRSRLMKRRSIHTSGQRLFILLGPVTCHIVRLIAKSLSSFTWQSMMGLPLYMAILRWQTSPFSIRRHHWHPYPSCSTVCSPPLLPTTTLVQCRAQARKVSTPRFSISARATIFFGSFRWCLSLHAKRQCFMSAILVATYPGHNNSELRICSIHSGELTEGILWVLGSVVRVESADEGINY